MPKGVPLNEQQLEDILVRYVQGMSVQEISDDLHIPTRTIYNNLKCDYIVKRLQEEATYVKTQSRNMIMRDATKYIKNLKDIANQSTDVRSKLKANETLLSYLIGSPTQSIDITVDDKSKDNVEDAKDLLSQYLDEDTVEE